MTLQYVSLNVGGFIPRCNFAHGIENNAPSTDVHARPTMSAGIQDGHYRQSSRRYTRRSTMPPSYSGLTVIVPAG